MDKRCYRNSNRSGFGWHERVRWAAMVVLVLLSASSCKKNETAEVSSVEAVVVEPVAYQGEEVIEVREKTVIELLAIKKEVKNMIAFRSGNLPVDRLIEELERLRSRLARVHEEAARLPKEEQMVIYGNLAVASNQLENGLSKMLAASPGNDELAFQVAGVKEALSPIPKGFGSDESEN